MLLALVLVTIGLLSSLAHLGKPARAWRAFSQWRTSWLSREGVLALLTYVPAVLLAAMQLPGMIAAQPSGATVTAGIAGQLVCIALIACALATVYCTAMIYASLTPIPAWRHRLVPPVYLLFARADRRPAACRHRQPRRHRAGPCRGHGRMLLAIALGLVKWRYWVTIDAPLPATRGDAVGLPQRTVTVFERPHTEANYLTREMAFVVARKHSRWLRRLAIVLFAVVPVLCMLPVWLLVHVEAAPWFVAAALSAIAGAFVERWLFFAEAKHMVTLYY